MTLVTLTGDMIVSESDVEQVYPGLVGLELEVVQAWALVALLGLNVRPVRALHRNTEAPITWR